MTHFIIIEKDMYEKSHFTCFCGYLLDKSFKNNKGLVIHPANLREINCPDCLLLYSIKSIIE